VVAEETTRRLMKDGLDQQALKRLAEAVTMILSLEIPSIFRRNTASSRGPSGVITPENTRWN